MGWVGGGGVDDGPRVVKHLNLGEGSGHRVEGGVCGGGKGD